MTITIEQVERLAAITDAVRDFAIDFPKIGPSPDELLRLCGWIFAKEYAIQKILINCQGTIVRAATVNRPRPDVVSHFKSSGTTFPPANCGFDTTILPVELPQEFDLSMEALLPDARLIPLAKIRGQHTAHPSAQGIQPLMLTSLGRTGTTALMRVLSLHPKIAIENVYPYETNAATYWMHMQRALALPAEEPAMPLFEWGDWNRPPLLPAPENYSKSLYAFVRNGYQNLTADFAHAAIEAFYQHLATSQKQSGVQFFCEKMLPSSVQQMFWNSYAGPREILLVRDFRDVFCSALAFNAKRGVVAFGRDRVTSDLEYVQDLGTGATRMALACKARGGTHGKSLIVRYEDLILQPSATLGSIFNYLGLDLSADSLHQMLSALRSDEHTAHRTSQSAQQSIGRWHRELADDLRQACRREFDELLSGVGYDLRTDGTLQLPQPEPGVAIR